MEKITLTGGTLMEQSGSASPHYRNDHSHSYNQEDPLQTPQPQSQSTLNPKQVTLSKEQQVELSKLIVRPQQGGEQGSHHNHSHGHSHGHGHSHHHHQDHHPPGVQLANWQQAGGVQVPAAALALMVPLEEILKGSPNEIMEALSTLLRLGQFEKWEQLARKMIEREKENGFMEVTPTINTSSTTMDESDSSRSARAAGTNKHNKPTKKTWWLWIDINGHTLLHWAAKRGDDKRFVEFFLQNAPPAVLQELLHQTSFDNTAMTPLHWACTEPGAQSLGILSLFMKVGVNWEVTDSSGCTPLLIAAQYGQVEVCAYLLQKGRADLYAMDTSHDTALHWAAYKGSLPVCGLLWWYHEQTQRGDLMAPDSYGQTPLHLASLRGHTSVVRYLLERTAPTKRDKLDLLYHKDTNGRTPLDLAVHKHRPTVQAVLQEAQDKWQRTNFREQKQWQVWQRSLTKSAKQMTSLHAWKLWLGLTDHADEMDEAPQFPYYYLLCQAFIHFFIWYPIVFCPVHNPQTGLLWDFPFWHLLNVMLMALVIYCLHKTTFTNPGTLIMADDEFKKMPKQHRQVVQYWRSLYESTLESYATTDDMQKAIKEQPLCHMCHIARPLRSKHCRVARSCVLMFDHHCPFVNNTVGLYNYPYFYVLLVAMTFFLFGFIFNLTLYVYRSRTTPWFWLFLGIFHGIHIIPVGGMFLYHTQLCMANLTTNEHMNVSRYDYLMEKSTNSSTGQTTRRYRNPWFKGSVGNFLDRMSSSDTVYNLPGHYRQPQRSREGDDEQKQQRRALLSQYSNDSTV